ncbi:6-bladed beta-propeller [Algoriphagus resistens]|uniref:6-bladed beta-propeller n=1 Tax=Algoriphagus resistens TaxID=1750590 RepID=UPI000716B7B6|nr:6-bladed beta-propeller [Algoriphagus resistens]
MKQTYSLLPVLFCSIFISCSSDDKEDSTEGRDSLETIHVDLSEAREGKLSEFFEPEIEYIWLKENGEEGLLGRGVRQVIFHDEKIYVPDMQGCRCIQIFDRTGNYLNKIEAFGEGPGEYLQFYGAAIKDGEVMLSGVFPTKLMWFDLNGKFLREQKIDQQIGAAAYSDHDKRYYFYTKASESGDFFFESVNETFKDTVRSIPFDELAYYGYYSGASTLKELGDQIYFGMPFQDTIYEVKESKLFPRYVWDFGKYGQDLKEMAKFDVEVNGMEYIKFQNSEAKLYFSENWFILERLLISSFRHEGDSYNLVYNRETGRPNVISKLLLNDLDEWSTYANIFIQFSDRKIGAAFAGKTLYKNLQKKKEELGETGVEEYVKTKGKNFAQAAFAAKDSENPVLIIYTVKK